MAQDSRILRQQKNEITEYHIYSKLSNLSKDEHNKKVLKDIANEELSHYKFWKSITKKEIKPSRIKIWWYILLAKILGLSFSLRLMEMGENEAQEFYNIIAIDYPAVKQIEKDENEHEKKLIKILNDEKIEYASSIVLGLNDALVELTGTLAGLTFAFANSRLIGATGLIMGVAASLSMAASGYLSSKEEENHDKNAVKSAIYTGVSYIVTVLILVAPYFIFENSTYALITMLILTLLIILAYTFYISVAKGLSLKRKFTEMAAISLGVAIISFGIGTLVKIYLGIEI